MFDFSSWLNLPYVWGLLIATGIFLYVLLDGFDLGVGILFPLAPTNTCRDKMMNSIAPFWDGNETWLVLGGGGLFAAFPLAYSILLPAFYMPIIVMLLGLILRGVAFEFRFKANRSRFVWDYVFHFASLIAALCQGIILGAFITGVHVDGRHYAGGAFDWLTPFSLMTGLALVFGYALLGSTWLIMKTESITQDWARKVAKYALAAVGFFMLVVTISTPFVNESIRQYWLTAPSIYYLGMIPFIAFILYITIWSDLLKQTREYRPFLCSVGLFLTAYLGFGLSVYPWIVPYKYTLTEAAASGQSLSLLFVGVVPLLPLILGYTAYCYYIFRGKTDHEPFY